ncbi:LysR family transcriptional regulator [Paraburkholderia phymatum]|uniref:Transcriptional regulator, LysR family n=1 Tax=Paraburkholderia phymatum (strain DSM 17167 / CIP 108236 / LMG 21445 / STM815) TaxID=391038 RepID=B2JTC5_PARP8|nr:LysR family transcriptional regulator [Paraburkholderia phymatum]ACC75828.1 transcriptional regulator, LysR family [Paraburkholderia phymatum STM815]
MSFPRFTPRQLCAFVAVADLGSFAKAGERLSLSTSAISQLVSELESLLGFRLFDRTTRTVSLTPAGREFQSSAKNVLVHMELAKATADDIRNRAAGIVRVAAPLILASTILPAAVKAYAKSHPGVLVRIRDTQVEDLIGTVNKAAVDLAVGPDQPVSEGIARMDLFRSPWVLWFAPSHPLIKRSEVTWNELREHPLVVAGRDYERTISLTHNEYHENERITPVDIVDNISTAFGMAAEELGLVIAPAYVGLLGRRFDLEMRPIVEPEVTRQVCLYQSSTRAASPAAEGFRDHLISWLAGKDDLGQRARP